MPSVGGEVTLAEYVVHGHDGLFQYVFYHHE
jgi:delta-aminolevulinic acid dehydratase/porphobilinogen synthase